MIFLKETLVSISAMTFLLQLHCFERPVMVGKSFTCIVGLKLSSTQFLFLFDLSFLDSWSMKRIPLFSYFSFSNQILQNDPLE